MKKMKRIVAVLLAGVMALTMLTACGGGASLFTYNAAISNAIVEKLGIPSTNDKVIVNAIEDTTTVIAENPNEYLTQFTTALNAALENGKNNTEALMAAMTALPFYNDFGDKLNPKDSTTINFPLVALLDREDVTENDLLDLIDQLMGSSSPSFPEASLCVRVYEIEDSLTEVKGDGVWAIFMVVSMDSPDNP